MLSFWIPPGWFVLKVVKISSTINLASWGIPYTKMVTLFNGRVWFQAKSNLWCGILGRHRALVYKVRINYSVSQAGNVLIWSCVLKGSLNPNAKLTDISFTVYNLTTFVLVNMYIHVLGEDYCRYHEIYSKLSFLFLCIIAHTDV